MHQRLFFILEVSPHPSILSKIQKKLVDLNPSNFCRNSDNRTKGNKIFKRELATLLKKTFSSLDS